jgi:hypothetical protein
VITFIGGVSAFVVGAGFVGGAIALARLVQRAKLPWWAWLLLGVFTVLLSIGVGLVIHVGRRQWMRNDPKLTVEKMLIEQSFWIILLVLLLLMWIGLAAGFK